MGTTRSTVFKILITSVTFTAVIILLLDLSATTVGSGGCDSSVPAALSGALGLDSAFRELISLGWLAAGDRAVFIGPDAISAAVIARRMGLPAAIAVHATACCTLPFDEESFDFAFSAALDQARVPARVVLEMERVLRPGRVGAIFRHRRGRPEGLMKTAAPVASLLRLSDVIGARAMNGSAMVVFRKHRRGGGAAARWSIDDDEHCKERMRIMRWTVTDVIGLVRAAIVVATERFGIGIDLFGG